MTVVILKGVMFAALLICAAVTDIKHREVDGWVCAAILIVSLIGSGGSFWGAVTAALPFFIASVFSDNRMGGGDIKLMFACGAVLGVCGGLLQSILGLSLAALFSLGAILQKRAAKTAIPLAPFLCAGGIAAFIFMNMRGVQH
jgi:leader peptidase (prepilin peptidase)/N-methyltransferase